MSAQSRGIIAHANSMLRTFALALNSEGKEIVFLLNAGTPHSRVASLYPYSRAEWQPGYDRLTLDSRTLSTQHSEGETQKLRFQIRVRRVPALTPEVVRIMTGLARRLDPTSTYLDSDARSFYDDYAIPVGMRQESHSDDLEMLVLLLHVIATSPDAVFTLDEPADPDTRAYVRQMLEAAALVASDPQFHPSA